MKYLFTDFYTEFSCVGGICPDTCCAGWDIFVDENTYKLYDSLPEPNKSSICGRIEEVNKSASVRYQFKMKEDGRCPFLNENNLCDIYIQVSPDALCQTCKTFPRKIVNYYDVIWATVSAACPEVARSLLSKKEPVGFGYNEDSVIADTASGDWILYNELINGLVLTTDILQDKKIPFWQRVHMAMNLTGVIQSYIEEKKLQFLREQMDCVKTEEFRKRYIEVHGLQEKQKGNEWDVICALLKEIDNMSVSLGEKMAPLQKYKALETLGTETYDRWRVLYLPAENEVELENLAVAFVFEYYMDALKGKSLLTNMIKMVLLLLEIRTAEIVVYNEQESLTEDEKALIIAKICRCMENTELLDIVAKRMTENNSSEQLLELAYLLR